jgi:outer membrane protein assembly factor BamB
MILRTINTLAIACATVAICGLGAGVCIAQPGKSPVASKDTGADEKKQEDVTTGDWPMWGGTPSRNMANMTTHCDFDFDPESGKNILWTAKLGSQTYGNPVVAGGKVLVGTNNGGEFRKKHVGDRGIVLCFDEKDGKLLWQLTRQKLEAGRVNDWPLQGICSTPIVENGLMYVVTNRCELMCVDMEGFHDGENDGDQDEDDTEDLDADIIWKLDMINELGVFPHNLATSSPVIVGDLVYVVTSNGVDEAHLEIPAPRSPCFIAVNKKTGELVWEDNTPFDQILHGQWSSPAVGQVGMQTQIIMPGGDGWIYALDSETGKHIWKFDLNPKKSAWELGGRGDRNNIVGTPVFYDNSVIVAVGQDPEHGGGVGHLYRIDATGEGDVSAELGEKQGEGRPNPNSKQIWHYGGIDVDGSITGMAESEVMRRTISTVAVHDGLVYAADLTGYLHCVDLKTGKRHWQFDTLAAIWGSPLYVDGHILLGTEESYLYIFKAGPKMDEKPRKIEFPLSVYSTPTIANGVMFISDRSTLYAIKIK